MRHDQTCIGIDEVCEEVYHVVIDPDNIDQVETWLYENGIYRHKQKVYAEICTIYIQEQEFMIYCDDTALIDGEAHVASAICTDTNISIHGPILICRLNEDRSEALPLREKDKRMILNNIGYYPNPVLFCKKRRDADTEIIDLFRTMEDMA